MASQLVRRKCFYAETLNEVQLSGFGNRQAAFVNAKFAIDIFGMVEDSVHADEELLGDFFVFQAGGTNG